MSINLSLTESLAAFVVECSYDALPTEVIAATKRRILDTIGVAWAGSTAPGCEGARVTVLAEGAKVRSTGTSVPLLITTPLSIRVRHM